MLSSCAILSICNYLSIPNGTIEIHDNATGCDSQEEVEEACDSIQTSAWKFKHDEYSFTIIPNPLESTTRIQYKLYKNSHVTIQILDISGQIIKSLVNETYQKGEHAVVFDGGKIKAGIYFCVFKTTEGVQTRKIIKL